MVILEFIAMKTRRNLQVKFHTIFKKNISKKYLSEKFCIIQHYKHYNMNQKKNNFHSFLFMKYFCKYYYIFHIIEIINIPDIQYKNNA